MVYADAALKEMENIYKELGLDYSVESITESSVAVDIKMPDTTIHTWFNVQTSNYGFDMMNGGSKSFNDSLGLRVFLSKYIDLIQTIIPCAKKVADKFSTYIRKNLIYDTFFGKVSTGFTIVFRVLSDDGDQVQIVQTGDTTYHAQLVLFSPDKSQYKIVDKLSFEYTDYDILLHKDIDYAFHRISEWENVTISCSESEFTFKFEDGYEICASVNSSDFSAPYYEVSRVNDEFQQLCVTEAMLGGDLFDENELHKFIVKYAECNDIPLSGESHNSGVKSDGQGGSAEVIVVDGTREVEQTEQVDESKTEIWEEIKEDEQTEEVKQVFEEEVSVPLSKVEIDETKPCDDFEVFKVLEDNTVVAVRFMFKDAIYDMNLDVIEYLGVPLGIICNFVEIEQRHGVKITQQERDMHMFATDISDNKDICRGFVERLFN